MFVPMLIRAHSAVSYRSKRPAPRGPFAPRRCASSDVQAPCTATPQVLDLSHNQLTSSLPESWGRLAFLASLSLRSNSLEGALPACWSSQAQLLQL